MQREEFFEEDILRKYIHPENAVKAPEGFSSKVMSGINLEARPQRVPGRNLVPYITFVIIAVLTAASFLVPSGSIILPGYNLAEKINISLPDIRSGLIPEVIMYVIAGVVLLAAFDAGLRSFFRGKKSGL